MLHIIYRTWGGEETRAEHKRRRKRAGEAEAPVVRTEWFDKPLYFDSFARELDDSVKVTIVYDGDRAALREHIESRWIARHPDRFTLHRIDAGNDSGSLRACLEIADADQHSDYLYFLEDDYLHRPGWLAVLYEGFDTLPEDAIITLYDHRDRYTRDDDVTAGRESVALSKSTHWRTAESTTNTRAMRRSLWPRVRDILMSGGIRDRETFRALAAAGVRLWQPIPGYSTHDHPRFLSPLIDWRQVALEVRQPEAASDARSVTGPSVARRT